MTGPGIPDPTPGASPSPNRSANPNVNQGAGRGPGWWRLRLAVLVLVLVFGLAGVVALGLQARKGLEDLRTAALDNVQWTASQLEVDLLRLILALQDAEIALAEGADMGPVIDTAHLRFDILYSRVGSLSRGAPYQALQHDPAAIADLDRIRSFATGLAERFDAGDAALIEALPGIRAELTEWHLLSRRLVLRVLEVFSATSDQQRVAFGDLIVNIAALGLGLLAVMTALVLGLLRLQSRQRRTAAALLEARDAALEGQRAKSAFIAVMSHEMRTPLNGTLAALDLAAEKSAQPPRGGAEVAELISVARGSAEQLLDRLNEVLDIARLEAGKIDLRPAPFRPGALLDALVAAMGPLAAARGNRLWRQADPALPDWVSGDASRIRQILQNLVGNAVKFTENGEVEVSTQTGPEGVVFAVRDTGPGISAADQARIFDDFVMIDAGYERVSQGSGLGLGICRRLADAMGGTVEVESTLGTGSTFRLRLPLRPVSAPEGAPEATVPSGPEALAETGPAASEPAPPQAAPVSARGRTLSLLVVEDNPTNRLLLTRMLEAEGHKVAAAANGAEGVAMAQDRRFDAILMDISMPGMDGLAATRAIRTGAGASASVPIYAVTAHAMPAERTRFLAAGMRVRLGKPVRLADLRAALAEIAADSPAPPPSELGADAWAEGEECTDGGTTGGSSEAATDETHPGRGGIAPDAAHATPAEPAEAPPLLFDPDAAETTLGRLPPDHLASILGMFASDSALILADLQAEAARLGTAADPDEPAARIRARAHEWRGSAATVGCLRLAAALRRLEHAAIGTAPETGRLQSMISALGPLWDQTMAKLPNQPTAHTTMEGTAPGSSGRS